MANEKRLIDANAMSIEIFATKCTLVNGESEWMNGYRDALQAVLELIGEAPTVDAVEVVRCKDCIHNFVRYGENKCYCGHPDGLNDILRSDDFCSYGERREGE